MKNLRDLKRTSESEKEQIKQKCNDWSYDSNTLYNDLVLLGNGFDEEITATVHINTVIQKQGKITIDDVTLI